MFGDQTEKKTGGPQSRKKKDADEEKTNGRDEVDFVDEKELKGALQLGVLKTADSVALRVGGRNGLDMEINEEVVNQVAAFVWDTVSDNWVGDLARFASHAGRQKVSMDDISLLTRRNPDLLEAACKLAGVNYHQESTGTKSGKGRKRKKDDVAGPSVVSKSSKDEEGEDVTAFDEKTLHTPKSYSKKPKMHTDFSRNTSTPIVSERTLKFPDDITPIRPTDDDVLNLSNQVNLSAIQEEKTLEQDDEDQDSFDIFASTMGRNDTSKTVTNMSSLVRQAEEHHSSVVEPTKDRIENERLERMIPNDEYENYSADSFDDYEVNVDPAPIDKSVGTPKNAVFSKKMSSFAFDDDDSFDDPVVVEPPSQTTPKPSSSGKQNKKVESASKSTNRKSKSLLLKHDSFDEFDFDI